MRKFSILYILCLISFTLHAQNNEALNYINQNAIALDTTNADTGYHDLLALKSVLSNRLLVGMGEATHGTHEFQATKFRMFKFLVQEMGYKLFGIEANFTECRSVNDYVLYGKGDARTAIGGTYFWTWKTKEMLQMVEWMHSYNINKPDSAKIKFYGFDMEFDRAALKSVTQKLKRFDSVYYFANFNAMVTLKICDTSKTRYAKFSKEKADSTKQLLADIKVYLDKQNANLLKVFSADEIAYLKHDVRLLEQCLDFDLEINKTGYVTMNAEFLRDKFMAENVEWVLKYEGPKSKMMIWAHNGHIEKSDMMMGSYLKRAYKDDYYAIGFDFNKGTFRATDMTDHRGVVQFTVGDAEKGSTSFLFSQLNIPAFFIDIENAVKTGSPAKSFFIKSIKHRSISAGYSSKWESTQYLSNPLYDCFDGLIFINDTKPTQPM